MSEFSVRPKLVFFGLQALIFHLFSLFLFSFEDALFGQSLVFGVRNGIVALENWSQGYVSERNRYQQTGVSAFSV